MPSIWTSSRTFWLVELKVGLKVSCPSWRTKTRLDLLKRAQGSTAPGDRRGKSQACHTGTRDISCSLGDCFIRHLIIFQYNRWIRWVELEKRQQNSFALHGNTDRKLWNLQIYCLCFILRVLMRRLHPWSGILALQGFCPPGDIWQCLTAFWVVTARGGWYSWHLVGEGQGSAYHPTMHWSASTTHTTQNHLAPNVSSAWSTGTFNVNLSPPQDDLFAQNEVNS